jgi:hypothetical protein
MKMKDETGFFPHGRSKKISHPAGNDHANKGKNFYDRLWRTVSLRQGPEVPASGPEGC